MNKVALVAAALFAVSMGSPAIAATSDEMKAASKNFNAANAKSKAAFDKSIAECKKKDEGMWSNCYKEARQARRKARDEAGDAYTKTTGKPEPLASE